MKQILIFTALNEEVNSINITIPSDIELGNYIIKFSYLNNDIIIIPKIIIYEDSFSIKQGSYFSMNTFRLSNITIPFEGEYRSGQVKKIYFINDNNRDKIDITSNANFNNKNISFNSNHEINNLNQYHIEIVGAIKTYYYYLYYLGSPTNEMFNLMNNIDLTRKNNLLTVTNNYSVYFCELIKKIESTNNLKFKILDCFNNELQLSLDYSKVQPEINDSNEIYTNIIFYYEDNKQISLDAKILTKNYYLKKIPFTNQKVINHIQQMVIIIMD